MLGLDLGYPAPQEVSCASLVVVVEFALHWAQVWGQTFLS